MGRPKKKKKRTHPLLRIPTLLHCSLISRSSLKHGALVPKIRTTMRTMLHCIVLVSLKSIQYTKRTATLQKLVKLRLVLQLRMLRLHALQLDGHFFAIHNIGTDVNVSKRATADLASKAIFISHTQLHPRGCRKSRQGVCVSPSGMRKRRHHSKEE